VTAAASPVKVTAAVGPEFRRAGFYGGASSFRCLRRANRNGASQAD